MFFFPHRLLDNAWIDYSNKFEEGAFGDVISMKVSTMCNNSRARGNNHGVIILYCSESNKKDKILQCGRNIIKQTHYNWNRVVYYKTNLQTEKGTAATGIKKNWLYKLKIPNYIPMAMHTNITDPIVQALTSYGILKHCFLHIKHIRKLKNHREDDRILLNLNFLE